MSRAGFSGGSEQLAVQHGAVVIDGYFDVDVFVGVDPADDSTMRRDLLRSGSYEVTPALTDRAAGVSAASGSPEPTYGDERAQGPTKGSALRKKLRTLGTVSDS